MFCVRGSSGAASSSPLGGGPLDGVTPAGPRFGLGRAKGLTGLVFETRPWFALLLLCIATLWLWPGTGLKDLEPAGLGKRLVPIGMSAPKGGGHFKVGDPYEIDGQRFVPAEDPDYERRGIASWYGALFHGRHTANGEIFDMERLSAAHPTLPLPVYAQVVNLENGLSTVVRVNDRGPFRKGRLIDLSERAAEVLGFKRSGTAKVKVRYLGKASLDGDDTFERDYLASRGYSQYAGTKDPDGGPEVEIAVGPPGPPAPPPLPDRPDRTDVAVAQQVPAPADSSEQVTASDSQAASVLRVQADPETTGSLRPSFAVPRGPMIQAGFFKNEANAERARGALAGVGPVEIAEIVEQGETYYRVRVGPFADGITAAAALSDVADAGYRGAKIVLKN